MKTTIYLSTGRGVSVITGSDRDWHGEVRLKDHHVQCVAADVNREGLVYCGTLGEGAAATSTVSACLKGRCRPLM